MSKNNTLSDARKHKNDEFFTMLEDIEKEMVYYKDYFKDKVIYCNCDNPKNSNFWKYFHIHFKEFGLKKLICTYYDENNPTYKFEYIGGADDDFEFGIRTDLFQNGDFRNVECIEILKDADIVVTNPPFSLFREYVSLLIKYNKQFIIIGNIATCICKDIFTLFKENKIWLGVSIHSGDRKFYVPDNYPLNATVCGIDKNGNKFIRVKGIRWYTNLNVQKITNLKLTKMYVAENYPKYDYLDVINVDKVSDIPKDYDGIMGVPITFLDKYNPEQFQIVDLMNRYSVFDYFGVNNLVRQNKASCTCINGKPKFARILIRKIQ